MRWVFAFALICFGIGCLYTAFPKGQAGHFESVACVQLPAFTGDTTTSAGSCTTTDNFHLVGGPTTVTASSTGIQFANLPAGYNSLFLNCVNMTLSSTSNNILVQIGEGSVSTPTWETGAHYTYQVANMINSTAWTVSKSTTSTDLTSGVGVGATTTPSSIRLYLDNYTSTTVHKLALASVIIEYTSLSGILQDSMGYWNNDTGAVTGLQIVPSAGTASMTCTIYAIK